MHCVGLDVPQAVALLESTDWNLERAVAIHFDPPGDLPENGSVINLSDDEEDEDEDEDEDELDDGMNSDPLCTPPRARIRRPLKRRSTGFTPPRAGVVVPSSGRQRSFSASSGVAPSAPSPSSSLVPSRSLDAGGAASPPVRAPILARMSVLANEAPMYMPPRAPRHQRVPPQARRQDHSTVFEAFRDFQHESTFLAAQHQPGRLCNPVCLVCLSLCLSVSLCVVQDLVLPVLSVLSKLLCCLTLWW
jgi:UBA-like domain